MTGEVDDPTSWKSSFPLQYDADLATVDQERTRFDGSDALPRVPTTEDPRTTVARSKLAADPRPPRMWAGYGFAIDYREDPLLDAGHACQVCHPIAAEELVARAEAIQDRTLAMQETAIDRPMDLIDAIGNARSKNADDPRLEAARQARRRAIFLVDFASSESSDGFHGPQEAARLLFLALDEILAGTQALETFDSDHASQRPAMLVSQD